MKVKLLKKVRKRFSIYKIEKLGSNERLIFIELANFYKLPFYYIHDHKYDDFEFPCNSTVLDASDNLKDLKNNLQSYIKKIYFEEFKHKPRIQTKV